ncbi:MAG: FCD domain-containing protein [Gammaproteobacteria bacterium]
MARSSGTTLSEAACARLRADIIAGRLEPQSKLRIEELRQVYDTGASPLREALSRLAGEGFVTAEGQRGFTVAPISVKDLDEITRLRIMLECEAITESIARGDDAWEAGLVAAYHQLSKAESSGADEAALSDWEARNQAFHEALIAACDSAWLLRLRRTLFEQHKRYRMISLLGEDASRDVPAEHAAIFDATMARDVAAACAATEVHIQRTAELTRAALAQSERAAVATA